MKRPSVIFINRVYPPVRGASGRVLRDLARAFARDGWSVTILTTCPNVSSDRDGTIKIKSIKAAAQPKYDITYVWIWLRLMITALLMPKTDLVVTLSDPPMIGLAGKLLARFRGAKHIHWCHDLYPDLLPVMGMKFPGFFEKFLMKLSRDMMKNADKVIVIGRCMARYLNNTGVDPKKMTVIPNWPDPELIRVDHENTEFQKNLGAVRGLAGSKAYDEQLKHGPKFRLLYAGSLGRAHPYKVILDAAEWLSTRHPEIEFVFVGDGKGFKALAAERARRGLENVRLLPYQPNNALKQVMESGDVHIVSMADNAAGLLVPCKFYSALAVGRPCIFIGPELCEVSKVIHDFKAGVVVPQNDAQALAQAVLEFRMNGEVWFNAHEGALKAGNVFVPEDAIDAWLSRARALVNDSKMNGGADKTGATRGYVPAKGHDYEDHEIEGTNDISTSDQLHDEDVQNTPPKSVAS